MKKIILVLICLVTLLLLLSPACGDRTVTDSRGKEVTLPDTINSSITISDSFLEEVMYRLGVIDTLIGVGSSSIGHVSNYSFESTLGSNFTYNEGSNIITALYPKIGELPVVAAYNTPTNYEKIAALNPDVVIVRAGDCSFWLDDDAMKKTVERIESLGIPVVVSYGPNLKGRETGKTSDISAITDEVKLMGSVFNKEEEAAELTRYLDDQINMISERTKNVPDSEKTDILILGLSPNTRAAGAAADSYGLSAVETSLLEDIVHAKNAFRQQGQLEKLNAEQILSIQPDVILLSTDWGYHPARELYEAPYYQVLQELEAVKNKRVYALPWLPSNCDKRIEYPIEVMIMAKAAYPELFSDIDLSKWILDYYKNVFGVDDATAKKLLSAQWLDWTTEAS